MKINLLLLALVIFSSASLFSSSQTTHRKLNPCKPIVCSVNTHAISKTAELHLCIEPSQTIEHLAHAIAQTLNSGQKINRKKNRISEENIIIKHFVGTTLDPKETVGKAYTDKDSICDLKGLKLEVFKSDENENSCEKSTEKKSNQYKKKIM